MLTLSCCMNTIFGGFYFECVFIRFFTYCHQAAAFWLDINCNYANLVNKYSCSRRNLLNPNNKTYFLLTAFIYNNNFAYFTKLLYKQHSPSTTAVDFTISLMVHCEIGIGWHATWTQYDSYNKTNMSKIMSYLYCNHATYCFHMSKLHMNG